MTRLQIIVVSSALVLLLGLYFGGRTHPSVQKEIELSRAADADKASINDIIAQSKAQLSERDRNLVGALESELDIAGNDSSKLDVFKKLSNIWYQKQEFAVSGFYAEEVAQIDNSDTAWSLAGISYALCFTNTNPAENERIYNFCYEKAITAFENAVSIAPDSLIYKQNLAYCYTQNPQQTMQGIAIYRGILEQDPNNLKVLLTLGKLSVNQTKDYAKALPRLEKAVEVAPNNFEANYYLAQTYTGLERPQDAKIYYQKALSLTDDESLKKNISDLLNNL